MRCALAIAVALALVPCVRADAVCKKFSQHGNNDRNLVWTTKDDCMTLVPSMQTVYPTLAAGLTCVEYPVGWFENAKMTKGFMLGFSITTATAAQIKPLADAFEKELDADLEKSGLKVSSMLVTKYTTNIFLRLYKIRGTGTSPADCALIPSQLKTLAAQNIPGVFAQLLGFPAFVKPVKQTQRTLRKKKTRRLFVRGRISVRAHTGTHVLPTPHTGVVFGCVHAAVVVVCHSLVWSLVWP